VWHVPPRYYVANPYREYATFAVVRDPYTRAISEYNCPWTGYKGQNPEKASTLNRWLAQQLSSKFGGGNRAVSFQPQHTYIWGEMQNNGMRTRYIDEIIRFENLHNDFAALMARYGLQIELPQRHVNAAMPGGRHLLLPANLTNETVAAINKYAGLDFELLNYSRRWGMQKAL
jgi:hypothetical protein